MTNPKTILWNSTEYDTGNRVYNFLKYVFLHHSIGRCKKLFEKCKDLDNYLARTQNKYQYKPNFIKRLNEIIKFPNHNKCTWVIDCVMRSVFVYIMDQVLIEGWRNAAQLKHAIRVVGGEGVNLFENVDCDTL